LKTNNIVILKTNQTYNSLTQNHHTGIIYHSDVSYFHKHMKELCSHHASDLHVIPFRVFAACYASLLSCPTSTHHRLSQVTDSSNSTPREGAQIGGAMLSARCVQIRVTTLKILPYQKPPI